MGHIEIDFWEILLHVSVIILLGVTVLYLIKERGNKRRNILKIQTKGHFQEFNQEIISQLITLQAERALATISATVERENRMLHELISKGNIAIEGIIPLREKQNQSPVQFHEATVKDNDNGASSFKPFPLDESVRPATLGGHAEELTGTEGMSKSELLLMEKLNKYAHESDAIRHEPKAVA